MDPWPDSGEIVTRLTQWLEQTRSEAEALDDASLETATEAVAERPESPYQLLEQLTALRHEIKLATKAARAGEERGEATLLAMQAAIEAFREIKPSEQKAADEAAGPLVETLVDLDESLRRTRAAVIGAKQGFAADCRKKLQGHREHLDQLFHTQSWWRRWVCKPWYNATRDNLLDEILSGPLAMFESILEGIELIQHRLQRAMDQQEIIRMQCVGRAVDPHTMTVMEVVNDPALPRETVCEEVRAGYFWKGKTFRFAEVKAVGRA